jgi:hypothetical protein
MANTHQFHSDPIPSVQQPARIIKHTNSRIFIRRNENGFSTDIGKWLEENQPRIFSELMDLRRALYSKRSHGLYRIRNHDEVGQGSFVLVGFKGKLLIEHDKPRYYLLRQLNRLRRAKGWPPLTQR